MMGHRIAYGATTKINRKEFGLSFNAILDGRIVVSDEIQITIEGELVEQPAEAGRRALSGWWRRPRALGAAAGARVFPAAPGPGRPAAFRSLQPQTAHRHQRNATRTGTM
jgi:hypothetical protein